MLIGFLVPFATPRANAGVKVTGRIVYSNVNASPENAVADNGEAASIFSRGLSNGLPVAHVRVELRTKTTDILVAHSETDTNGNFTMETGFLGYNTPNILRVEARNDKVRVKMYAAPFPDNTIGVETNISSYYGTGDVSLPDVGIDDATDTFALGTIPCSRAFWVAGAVYRGARHIETCVSGLDLGEIKVRMGWPLTAWYDHIFGGPTIYLPSDGAAIVDHEYGHHIENSIGSFGLIPGYLTKGHAPCDEQGCEVWPWFEGAATFLGAANSRGFTNVSDVSFYGDPEAATSYLQSLGHNWWVEEWLGCSTSSVPQLVESVVAHVLWDLVDSHPDTDDPIGSGVPEVAEIPFSDVLDVIRTVTSYKNDCGAEIYIHPATLGDFAYTYLTLHSSESVHPDIYAAFAFNGVLHLGGVWDDENPDAVTITSSSHPEGVWKNVADVSLTITDGADDFSGSFYYWWETNTQATLTLREADTGIGTEDFQSKATVNELGLPFAEGDNQYIHVQTRDLAGHLGTTAHYGPVRIDLTKPEWISTSFPNAAQPYLIGKYLHFEWQATDNLSGVNYVRISYNDTANGIAFALPATIYEASGSYDFYLNPNTVVPTTAGYFTITVVDNAGNSRLEETANLTIVSPFEGPHDLGLGLDQGRVVSGDLNGDGKDEIVISGKMGGARILKTIQLSPAVVVQDVVAGVGMEGGDLFLADTDRDGDLDLVAAGDFGGGGPEIRVFRNNGVFGFTDLGALPVTALSDMVVRVVDLHGTGEPILIYGGKLGVGAAHKELRAYKLITGGAVQFLSGTFFRGGDFEVGDINADGIFDFVTLSYNAAGTGSVDWYLGTSQEGTVTWTRGGGTGAIYPEIGDVDLGNWDDDNDLEFFMMYQVTTPAGTQASAELWEWTGTTFALALAAGGQNQIAEGDGHIVDIYNGGRSHVFALGRRVSGALSSWYVTNEELGRKGTGVPFPVKANLLYDTDTAWGDFDNDGDLDFVVTGASGVVRRTAWYENKVNLYGRPNNSPPAPKNLLAVYDPVRVGYALSWEAPGVNTDETAETAFEYEIRVGNAPGTSDIVSWAHPAGHGQQVAPQFVGGHFERFVPMPAGPFDWCVRTVDSGWRRSDCGSMAAIPVAFADWQKQYMAVVPVAFADWQKQYYSAEQIANGDADATADSDGDGRATFLEYYLGSDPTKPNTEPAIRIERGTTSSTTVVSWERNRYASADGSLQTSLTVLGPWSLVPDSAVTLSDTENSAAENLLDFKATIDLKALTPSAMRLFRLQVSVPTP